MNVLSRVMALVAQQSAEASDAPNPSAMHLAIFPAIAEKHGFPFLVEVVNVNENEDTREVVEIMQKADGINVTWSAYGETLEAALTELEFTITTSLEGAA